MFQAFVLNNVAYGARIGGGTIAGYNEVDRLAPGALAIFAEDTNALIDIATPGTQFADIKAVRFAIGKKDGSGAQLSQPIDRNLILNYTASNYNAGAASVTHLGNNGTTGALNLPTLVDGMDWNVWIQDDTNPARQHQIGGRPKYNISGVVKTGDTAATILAAIVDEINARLDIPVNAAVVGSNVGLSFTADAPGINIKIGASGIFEASTIIYTTPFNNGVNRNAEVVEVLKTAEGEFGRQHGGLFESLFWKYETNYNPATNYDSYVLTFNKQTYNATGLNVTNKNVVVLYMPNAATIQAQFQAIMAIIIGRPANNNPEPGTDAG